MSEILRAENVSKKFVVRRNRPQTIKEVIGQRLTGHWDSGTEVWALRDVSFNLEKGCVQGIIGHNGAGKSTLLRLLCGLGRPSSGRIGVTGTIGSLLELGNGFHPDMTGRENLMTGGILSGLTRKQVRSIEAEIISFAELEEFIDQPVRTYSSGMYTRLAFASAIHLDPDLLIIDEVLAVGDSRFQKKCIEKLGRFRSAGKSIVLVSHDLDQIRASCDRVLVLEEGCLVTQGDPEHAINFYYDLMRQRTEKRAAMVSVPEQPIQAVERGGRIGTREVEIHQVHFRDAQNNIVEDMSSGSGIEINFSFRLNAEISDFAVILKIQNETDVKCFETQVPSARAILGCLPEKGSFRCSLPEVHLLPGRYYVDIGLYPTDWDYTFDFHWHMHTLDVIGRGEAPQGISGIVSISPVWSVSMQRELTGESLK